MPSPNTRIQIYNNDSSTIPINLSFSTHCLPPPPSFYLSPGIKLSPRHCLSTLPTALDRSVFCKCCYRLLAKQTTTLTFSRPPFEWGKWPTCLSLTLNPPWQPLFCTTVSGCHGHHRIVSLGNSLTTEACRFTIPPDGTFAAQTVCNEPLAREHARSALPTNQFYTIK